MYTREEQSQLDAVQAKAASFQAKHEAGLINDALASAAKANQPHSPKVLDMILRPMLKVVGDAPMIVRMEESLTNPGVTIEMAYPVGKFVSDMKDDPDFRHLFQGRESEVPIDPNRLDVRKLTPAQYVHYRTHDPKRLGLG
jgi:hypothetical protein